MKIFLLIFFLLEAISPYRVLAGEYDFDPAETEKKPYHFGGYLEFRPVLNGLDRNAALYQVRYYDQEVSNPLGEVNGKLQVEGSLEKGMARLFARLNTDLQNSFQGWSEKTTLYEGFLSIKPSSSLVVDAGKKTLKWGKGYAWNPVAFLDRPKNPDDPDLALEGYTVLSTDFTWSFDGPLTTFSFTPVLVPVYDWVNEDFGDRPYLNLAGKAYFLLYDTDLDLTFLFGGSRTPRVGFDFSRNLSTNFEVHGEWAWTSQVKKTAVDTGGKTSVTAGDKQSWLLGLRYLTSWDTTFIFEYYRNEAGFDTKETEGYFSFVHSAYDLYRRTGNEVPIQRAANFAQGLYGRFTPMQDYLYLRISQKEPADILYFTPAVTGIYNLDDRSFSLSPELLYNGFTNWEFRLKGTYLSGATLSEFGEKPNDYRVELRVRYYF
ncbi:MAG: hypothetical protein EHM75_00575 [Desulfobacteraceae bacterium]|nr:MAG: hypothetical protein EHM75_00575 [Desulfobacteraceae bacterium]